MVVCVLLLPNKNEIKPFSYWSLSKAESVNLYNVGFAKQCSLMLHIHWALRQRASGPHHSSLSSSCPTFPMIRLQSLLKFKKDGKSRTPVVVWNDCVVCVVVTTEADSCTKQPSQVHFNRSAFSVRKKIAIRTSDSGLLLQACLFLQKYYFGPISLYIHTHWWLD